MAVGVRGGQRRLCVRSMGISLWESGQHGNSEFPTCPGVSVKITPKGPKSDSGGEAVGAWRVLRFPGDSVWLL